MPDSPFLSFCPEITRHRVYSLFSTLRGGLQAGGPGSRREMLFAGKATRGPLLLQATNIVTGFAVATLVLFPSVGFSLYHGHLGRGRLHGRNARATSDCG